MVFAYFVEDDHVRGVALGERQGGGRRSGSCRRWSCGGSPGRWPAADGLSAGGGTSLRGCRRFRGSSRGAAPGFERNAESVPPEEKTGEDPGM